MAWHKKSEQKTEYGYKRRCGGKDGRGVQEKTAARSADARDQRSMDVAWHEKSKRKTEYGYKRAARAKGEAVGRQALAERAASEA